MRNIGETETNIMEDIDIDVSNLFDQIDDLLDFPTDVVDSGIFGSAPSDCLDFPSVWSENSSGFSTCRSHSASDLSAELSVPYEDIVQLEWLSTFVEDSFSGGGGGLTIAKPQETSLDNKGSFRNQFQTSSPVSVLESSSSVCSRNPIPVSHEKRARSKRPRPATFTPRAAIHLIAPAPSTPVTSSESGNFFHKSVEKQKKKRKVIKIRPPSENGSSLDVTSQNQNQNGLPVRKCMHCEITKTPQWRAGPMGPKSLCNACGVRHKTGRLYPEYRPAASPTFVPSLHSNSHKKVLEMRGCTTTTTKPEA